MDKSTLENFTQKDIEDRIQKIWDKTLDNSKFPTPVKDPTAFVLGGPPGAGKSSSMQKISHEYLDNNSLSISGDDFRRYHPNYEAIKKEFGDNWPDKTSKWSATVYREVFNRATEKGYNVQIEGTFRDKNVPLTTMDQLKDKGYSVNVAVVVASRDLSYKSALERYQTQKDAGQTPRAVDPKFLDNYYPKFSQNVEEIHAAKKHDRFLVYQREEGKEVQKVYDSTKDQGLNKEYIAKMVNDRSFQDKEIKPPERKFKPKNKSHDRGLER